MKALCTLLMACCLSLLGAQNLNVVVAGRIFYGAEGAPARNTPVNLYTEAGGVRTFTTDAEGQYKGIIPVTIPPNSLAKVLVEVRDFCNGETYSQVFIASADSLQFEKVNFTICKTINPPPPPSSCKAFFIAEPDQDSILKFRFINLSVSTGQSIQWKWDFGDGKTSTEAKPTHTYAAIGIYVVKLTMTTIAGDTIACTATYNASVFATARQNCNCTREYAPVCVLKSDSTEALFANKCLALCAGFSESQLLRCQDTTCVCPAVYAPVCVKLPDGAILEFGNACEAQCKGYSERDFVECPRDTCNCPTDEYAPVCVVVNGDTLTFTNKCYAYCKGFQASDIIACSPGACICPAVYDPVCVKLADGSLKQFGNSCEAQCAGFTESDFVPCDTTGCSCPKILDPVCAIGPNGDTLTFTNKCFAVCEGYNPEQLFKCRPNDCVCPPVIDPVCVKLADGQIIRYNNKCEAICNGFKETDIVRCDSTSCVCPEYYDPVCVVVNGDTIKFDNPCFAECKGYNSSQYFRCYSDPNCACPLNLDPVCVKVDGYLKRFPNACVAKCYGFTDADLVPCVPDSSDCVCPLYYAPVCAMGPNGDTITFSNKCFAACAGYDGNEIFTCNEVVSEAQCFAGFTVDTQDSFSLTVKFADIAKVLEGTILGWKWDFGDGTYGDSQNPVHTFLRPGIYTVTQYIATSTGCTASFSRIIYVGGGDVTGGPSCQAMFTFTQQPDNLNTIHFKNLSFGNISSILWEFGDGYTSSEKNPTHTFAYNGVFFVRLTIVSDNCTSTTSMVLFIDPNAVYDNDCNALFLPVLFVDSLQIAFRNMSSPDAKDFKWNFGDGTTSTEFVPIHTYREKGIYTVTLTITTADGCTSTFRAILNLGTQNFTGNPAYRALSTTGTSDTKVIRNLQLYPNPVKETFTLKFSTANAGSYLLQIFSLEGKLIQIQRENAQSGQNLIQLNSSSLSAGMYLLRIQTDGQTQSVKFIKQ